MAAELPAGELSTASFKKCPHSLWPNEEAGQISPGVVQLRVNLDANGKVLETALSTPGANATLEREAQKALLGCMVGADLLSSGAGWYKLRYVWGLQPSIKGVEREAIIGLMDDAVNGNVKLQVVIAVLYRSSRRFISDATESLAWMARGAQGGSADGQLALAIVYANGEGVAEDQAKATLWYGRSAQAGNATAQFLYAIQLEHGFGIAADPVAAMSWYRKAAAGGSAEAKNRLEKKKP